MNIPFMKCEVILHIYSLNYYDLCKVNKKYNI